MAHNYPQQGSLPWLGTRGKMKCTKCGNDKFIVKQSWTMGFNAFKETVYVCTNCGEENKQEKSKKKG